MQEEGEDGGETDTRLLNRLSTAAHPHPLEEGPTIQKPDGLASHRSITDWEGAGS